MNDLKLGHRQGSSLKKSFVMGSLPLIAEHGEHQQGHDYSHVFLKPPAGDYSCYEGQSFRKSR